MALQLEQAFEAKGLISAVGSHSLPHLGHFSIDTVFVTHLNILAIMLL